MNNPAWGSGAGKCGILRQDSNKGSQGSAAIKLIEMFHPRIILKNMLRLWMRYLKPCFSSLHLSMNERWENIHIFTAILSNFWTSLLLMKIYNCVQQFIGEIPNNQMKVLNGNFWSFKKYFYCADTEIVLTKHSKFVA